jgi:hypothetical protein
MHEKILFIAILNESHKRSSGSRRHISGQLCNQRPREVRIIRYDDDQEVYLIEYDENQEEIIDSLHGNIKEAMIQAEFDWGIKKSDWTPPLQKTYPY